MFGWFCATCPVDLAAKEWIEDRLSWLSEQFTRSAFSGRAVILPTHEFFPDPYDGSRRAVRMMLNRVCGYMGVSPDLVKLKLFRDSRNGFEMVNDGGKPIPTSAGGTYHEEEDQVVIRINAEELDDPMGLVGTIAHELSHLRLMGESRVSGEEFDNELLTELLTDLCAVFHGFGVFRANSPRNWDGHYSHWPGTNLKKPEYMTPPMYGYALAHLAWYRNERWPAWARHLKIGPKANFKQGLRYLRQTADSAFQPRSVQSDAEA